MKFTIATRGSNLAVCQSRLVQQQLQQKFPEHEWVLQTFTTTGDRIQDRPLAEFGGNGVFLKEIEEALLSKQADLAIHSLKDVPGIENPDLRLAAFLPREDPRDVSVSLQEDLLHLDADKNVGTSSNRRRVLVQYYRPDLKVDLLRGNLDTRLRKLKEGQYDAIVVAAAGLHRLQLFDASLMTYLSEEAFIPAIGQGILVIQTRKDSEELLEMLRQVNDSETSIAANVERKFLARYQGGCHLPIGGLATKRERWVFRAFVGGVRTGRILQDRIEDSDPEQCSQRMYESLEAQGAGELLAELERSPE
jgi:hydroxymethylbilane synthase